MIRSMQSTAIHARFTTTERLSATTSPPAKGRPSDSASGAAARSRPLHPLFRLAALSRPRRSPARRISPDTSSRFPRSRRRRVRRWPAAKAPPWHSPWMRLRCMDRSERMNTSQTSATSRFRTTRKSSSSRTVRGARFRRPPCGSARRTMRSSRRRTAR